MTEIDEDIITIHLGKVLSDEEYKAVVDSILAFMERRWPNMNYKLAN